MRWPAVVTALRAKLRELGGFLRRQTRQQRLLREIGGFPDLHVAAVAVDDLILRPLDRLVEQFEISHLRNVFDHQAERVPGRGITFDAGQDHCRLTRRQLTEDVGQQACRAPGDIRNAAQIEDEDLRWRTLAEPARNIVDGGKGERADEFDDPNILTVLLENLLFVRLPASPGGNVGYVVVGDNTGSHIAAAVEHMQIEVG